MPRITRSRIIKSNTTEGTTNKNVTKVESDPMSNYLLSSKRTNNRKCDGSNNDGVVDDEKSVKRKGKRNVVKDDDYGKEHHSAAKEEPHKSANNNVVKEEEENECYNTSEKGIKVKVDPGEENKCINDFETEATKCESAQSSENDNQVNVKEDDENDKAPVNKDDDEEEEEMKEDDAENLKSSSPKKLKRSAEYYDMMYPHPEESAFEPCDVPIHTPTPSDVLFGRGGLTNHHLGNKKFRKLVAEHKEDYVNALKVVKPRVAYKLVQLIRNGDPPGRFLKRRLGLWYDVGDRHAVVKTSQALREKSQDEKNEARKRQHNIASSLPMQQIGAERCANASKVNEMHSNVASLSKNVPELPPPYNPGFLMAPYAYYAMHSYGQRYPLPPPYYGMSYPPPPPVHMNVEQSKEEIQSRNPNDADGKEAEEQSSPEGTKNQEQYVQGPHEANVSFTNNTSSYYPPGGGIFGEVDNNGDIIVTERDILCGRGGAINHHKGNKRFRDIVAMHKADYVKAPKIEKPEVARMIVRTIRNSNPPGRFLKFHEGKWFDIGDKKAAEKSSQALREKPSRSLKKTTVPAVTPPAELTAPGVAPFPMHMNGFSPHPNRMGGCLTYPMFGQSLNGNPTMMSGMQPFSPLANSVPASPSKQSGSKQEKSEQHNDKQEETKITDKGKRKSPSKEDKENEQTSKKQKVADGSPSKLHVAVV